jgi:NlpC/P60 family putative phage cell wall peptidase
MTTQKAIIDSARKWIGTPFVHQGRRLGAGVDCAGVVIGVAEDLGIAPVGFRDPKGYASNPANRLIEELMDKWLVRVPKSEVQPGDILFFKYARLPQHMGILTDRGTFVHAYKVGPGVVEVTYDRAWQRATVRAYRFRGVECHN